MRGFKSIIVAGLVALLAAPAVQAGDCTGVVVGIRPLSQYNHAKGYGFLAVRSGPGTRYQQTGELYAGDEFWVADRRGNWVYVGCMSGRCENPLWGQYFAEGWAYAKYLSYGGVCP